ncbi:MAG TPA: NADH-quinone oxidoreductase subunit L [Micromonosporaceae bacterium]|nr:NADH-quinone oxidoreductase subunit L [Micromonosporaceae bacterium]
MTVDALGAALPAVPFAAALLGLGLPGGPRDARRPAAALGAGAAAVTVVLATLLLLRPASGPDAGVSIVDFGGLRVTFGTWVDGTAAMVSLAVALVALAVQVYSISYLAGDDRYPPYAAQVSLFTAAMLLVVVSGDLIVLLIGWEVMGICSYLLIGHDRTLPEAPRAAVKAFLVTRVGDVGFLLGIALLGVHAGSFRIADVLAADLSGGVRTAACLLLLAGVAGKSAQFPLHTWLPDAMAGPTPISALIHAATMVAAGVYVVARLYPLFTAAPTALAVLAVMAAITMLLGAAAALAQQDVKRVLAWSTVSQLGYMTGALAVGGRGPALFHLLTHAAFKALLFLAAGALIHAVGSNLMAAMGGLRRGMPATFLATTIGLAALAGVPPLAGFWSKDAILAAARGEGPAPSWATSLVWLAALTTVGLTGWYAMRLWLRVFFGPPGSPDAEHPHEPPWTMRAPMLLLAIPAAGLGFAALWSPFRRRLDADELVHLDLWALLPFALAAVGALLAWRAWRADPVGDTARLLPARRTLAAALHLDAVQDALVTRPVTRLAAVTRRGDEVLVDGAVGATGAGTSGLGGLLDRGHRATLPRAITAALGGLVLLGVVVAAAGLLR